MVHPKASVKKSSDQNEGAQPMQGKPASKLIRTKAMVITPIQPKDSTREIQIQKGLRQTDMQNRPGKDVSHGRQVHPQ